MSNLAATLCPNITLEKLKHAQKHYPSLFEAYRPIDNGEAGELDIPYYFQCPLRGRFELMSGNSLLDESNRIATHKLLSDKAITAYYYDYQCGSMALYIDFETFMGMADEQLQFIDNLLGSLGSYPAINDTHYSQLQWDYAHDQWRTSTLSDRIDQINNYNDYTGENILSIFEARRDTIPEEIRHFMMDFGELN